MRGATEAEVLRAAPAGEVVATLVAGPGPVRDLVPAEPGGAERLVDEFVARGLDVVVGVAVRVPAERRRGLDGERVGADVRRRRFEGDEPGQCRDKVVVGLGDRSVDDVDVVGRESDLADQRDGPRDRAGAMPPSEVHEDAGHERLHPQGDPGRASARGGQQEGARRALGVRFDRHLGARSALDRLEEPGEQFRGEERRRPAAEVDGRRWAQLPARSGAPDVGDAGVDVGLGEVELVGPGREGAVVATSRQNGMWT